MERASDVAPILPVDPGNMTLLVCCLHAFGRSPVPGQGPWDGIERCLQILGIHADLLSHSGQSQHRRAAQGRCLDHECEQRRERDCLRDAPLRRSHCQHDADALHEPKIYDASPPQSSKEKQRQQQGS